LAAALASCVTTTARAQSEFKFGDFRREKDTAAVRVSDGKALFTITSSLGIGAVTIAAERGAWPRDVTVHLRPLKSLEGFSITTDRFRAHGSQGTSGKFEFSLRNAKGEFDKLPTGGDYVVSGTLDIRVEKGKDEIIVVFPANLFLDAKQVRIEWIDAYRG
jgi:hypothetical protein